MAKNKRLTDCNKWSDKWFRSLELEEKLFYYYIHDRCDQAGVWVEDLEEVKFHIGSTYDPGTLLKSYDGEVVYYPDKRIWWLKNYCILQHTTFLKEEESNAPRKCAVRLLKEHNLYDSYVEHFRSSLPGVNAA